MKDSLVLCYHALSSDWDAELSVRPDSFAWQVELLLRRGYRPLAFSELVNHRHSEPVFAVTFDDAFQSVYTLAAPILDRLGICATLFVPTDYVDAQQPFGWAGVARWRQTLHAAEITPMTWSEVRALRDAGWEIGSHTCSHPLLTHLSDDSLAEELSRSREICEDRLGAACTSIAYPYGNLDGRVAAAAAAAGYRTAGALPGQFAARDPMQWPRIGIYNIDDERRFRLKVSLAMSRLRRSGLWSLYERSRLREPAAP